MSLFLACSSRSNIASNPLQASQTLDDLTLSQTSNGIVQWTLHSPHGEVLDQPGEVEVATPQIEIFKEGKTAGNVTSQKGLLHESSGDIRLSGSVVVISLAEKTTLKTEALDYVASKSQFRTDLPVEITRPSGVMRGRGMIANHDMSEIHVLHQESTIK